MIPVRMHGAAGRPALTLLAAALVCLVPRGAVPARAAADDVVPAKPISAAERNALFEELDRDASFLDSHGRHLRRIVEFVTPAVVHLETSHVGFYTNVQTNETGSGVLIEKGGKFYVLTNRHVIKDVPRDNVKLRLADHRLLKAERVWSDPETDVAVLAVSGSGLVAARLGDSDRLSIGDFVLAMGSPFGLNHSATYGIVSAKGRHDLALTSTNVTYQDFIQTDAAINPGNSGGPLINSRGELVGINTAIASNSGGNDGIGFSIPINMAMTIAEQLIDSGKVKRASLGVRLQRDFTATKAQELGLPYNVGALVTDVIGSSPAAGAGLKVDDVILEFAGRRVHDDNHLVNVVSLAPVGREIPITVFRGREQIKLTATLEEKK